MESLHVTGGDFVAEKQGKLRDSYRIGNKLGDGAFGSVRKITHRVTGEIRAVKTIHKKNLRSEDERQTFFNEVSVLRALDHPNILKLYEYYQDEKNYYLITELCNGGELFDRIISHGSFSEAIAATYMRQILSVVSYCHDRSIVHRDLKPENFLLDTSAEDANLKVIDFGTAQFFTPGVPLTAKFGTPYYIAPEVLKCNYDEKCDVWSVGVILYVMLCGKPPFRGSCNEEIYDNIVNAKLEFKGKAWKTVSKVAKDLVKKALQKDPRRRISIGDMFYDPWIRTRAEGLVPEKVLASRMLHRLAEFKNGNKLRTCTFSFLAYCLATANDLKQVRVLFEGLDVNGDGRLSREELQKGFKEYCAGCSSNVDDIIAQCDIDGNGFVDYSEFLTAVVCKDIKISKENLQIAFNALDKDGSGTISKGELQKAMEALTDQETIDKIMRDSDLNDDGEIDIQEFTSCILNSAIT